MQPQSACLRAQLGPGAHPAQQGSAGPYFRHQLIAERVQHDDRRGRGHAAVIGEGGVDAMARQLRRHERQIARRRLHDDAHVGLVGAYMGERVHPQQCARQGGHLIG
jgi:hypothetical protein